MNPDPGLTAEWSGAGYVASLCFSFSFSSIYQYRYHIIFILYLLQADLRDTSGSVLDYGNKANMAINQVT